jgi:hypothetical protein
MIGMTDILISLEWRFSFRLLVEASIRSLQCKPGNDRPDGWGH